MTDTDRIAQMAREAGLPAQVTAHPAFKQFVKEHASLVAEDCANVCMDYGTSNTTKACAQTIRARYK